MSLKKFILYNSILYFLNLLAFLFLSRESVVLIPVLVICVAIIFFLSALGIRLLAKFKVIFLTFLFLICIFFSFLPYILGFADQSLLLSLCLLTPVLTFVSLVFTNLQT